jgi:mRNA-degrading endonuclease RelE of RelBE toxin-antitoxin system
MGGGSVAPPLDLATEEEVEAMNAYRSQMLADLLAETSEEPEVKPISYYRKKKRSPKTWRSKSRGYRLKRV